MTTFADELRAMDACKNAVLWVGERKREQAWAECERADWMLWYAGRKLPRQQQVVLAACACARTVLQYVPEGEERPRLAIEAAEGWARGEVSIEELQRAAAASTAAAYAAASAYAHATAAASAADVVASRRIALRDMADIVRQIIPTLEEA